MWVCVCVFVFVCVCVCLCACVPMHVGVGVNKGVGVVGGVVWARPGWPGYMTDSWPEKVSQSSPVSEQVTRSARNSEISSRNWK